ncbi:MAG: ABC transporter permease [Candidatus Bathyarchaeia archaeon]
MGFPKFRVEKRPYPSLRTRIQWPVFSILIAMGFGAILIAAAGVNPLVGYYHLFYGALGSAHAISETLWRFTPLLLTGTAVALAFTCKFWNIGAEGQMVIGATVATFFATSFTGMPSWFLIPLVIVPGFLAGALWAAIPAILKAKLGVDDVVTTLLGNWVILYFVAYLVEGPWRDPTSLWPESPAIAEAARFPRLLPGYRLHLGFAIAIFFAILFFFIIKKTLWGTQIKAVGENPRAAGFMGINVVRVLVTVAILSGGIAGIAGVNELCGTHYHMKGLGFFGGTGELSWGYGYAGVFIAMLGGLSPIGVPLAAFFMAIMIQGSRAMYREAKIPSPFYEAMEGIILVCLLVGIFLTYYRIKRVKE